VRAALEEIAELVHRETGIVLPASRATAILAAVRRAAPELDPGAFVRAASDPDGGGVLVDRLIDEVTVKETAFARDRGQLDAIAWGHLLAAARAAGSETIKVWSAGCASGEEAYTLALLAAEAFAPAPPPVEVLGTDISAAAVAATGAGRYRERAVRALAPPLRQRYLALQADASYLVGEQLRSLVRVRRHNLARDPIPPPGEPGFDLISCRNVLIYFDAPLVERIIESFTRSLRPGGVLLLGAADALQRTERPVPASQLVGLAVRAPVAPERARRHEPTPSREQRLTAALSAADGGDRESALTHVASLLAENPLDADAHFLEGLVRLEASRPAAAAAALRRALYADASFGLAAFTLGRAYHALGDRRAARRAYQRALHTLDPHDDRHSWILQQVDIGDIAGACRAWLLGSGGPVDRVHV
jgi:chemotaxis protein methyltransferase CheR